MREFKVMRLFVASVALVLLVSGCGKSGDTAGETSGTVAQGDRAQAPVNAAPPEGSGRFSPVLSVPPTGNAVTVDGFSLTNADLEQQVQRAMASPRFARLPDPLREQATTRVRKELTEQFVSRQLLLQEVRSRSIAVDDEEVTAELERIRGTLPPGASLEEALGRAGITMERLNTDIREGLGLRKLIEMQVADVAVASDEEIAAYYAANEAEFEGDERVRARHILVKCDPTADETVKSAKRELAESYRQQLLDGKDFAELAKARSEGPSGVRGGDLGHFGRGQMVPPFDAAAFTQDIDAIGELVETQFGYHIIQVLDRREAGLNTLDEVRGVIAAKIEDTRKNAVIEAFVKELAGKASVTYGS